MNEVQTQKGVLKYRMPYATEMALLISESDMFDPDAKPLSIAAKMMARIEPMIDLSNIEGKPSFDDFIKDSKVSLMPLVEVCMAIRNEAMECLVKKN